MGFYDLNKAQRIELVEKIRRHINSDLLQKSDGLIKLYFSDEDTYIRKSAYLTIGRLYKELEELRSQILNCLELLLVHLDAKIRQTTINAAGEIGMVHFELVYQFFDKALFDPHHSVRNAVIGSVKKMSEKNPHPVLLWAQQYLQHSDKEIRREICHGIELRGRTHPQDILPLLQQLQFDKTARVAKTLVHVIGQIAYKKGCLETVVSHLKTWENTALVRLALNEIIDVHDRYKNFSYLNQAEVITYIDLHFPTI